MKQKAGRPLALGRNWALLPPKSERTRCQPWLCDGHGSRLTVAWQLSNVTLHQGKNKRGSSLLAETREILRATHWTLELNFLFVKFPKKSSAKKKQTQKTDPAYSGWQFHPLWTLCGHFRLSSVLIRTFPSFQFLSLITKRKITIFQNKWYNRNRSQPLSCTIR